MYRRRPAAHHDQLPMGPPGSVEENPRQIEGGWLQSVDGRGSHEWVKYSFVGCLYVRLFVCLFVCLESPSDVGYQHVFLNSLPPTHIYM